MIKSSFKKIEKNTISQRCYFGHPDLDAIFHNSLSKGHLIIMEEDHPSTNYLSLCRYFISHHYNQSFTSIVYDSTNKWRYLLSPLLKKEDKNKQDNVVKSEIAWRYDHMNIKLNNLPLDQRISFIDLSKDVSDPKDTLLKTYQYPNSSPREVYQNIQENFINSQVDDKDMTTKKLLLSSLPAYCYKDKDFSMFLKAIRCLTRSSNLLTLITVPPIISQQVRNKLIKYSDYYLVINKVGKGYEDFTGSLNILKQVQVGNLRSYFRGSSVWGLKSTKRQLRIQALYEQPLQNQSTKQKENDF